VLNDEAVLDNETGLVWERSPSQVENPSYTFYGATSSSSIIGIDYCDSLEVGGRKGWHNPTIQQLASLVDTSAVPSEGIALPQGHPFDTDCTSGGCVTAGIYWTITRYISNTSYNTCVDFSTGEVVNKHEQESHLIWCVRGGNNELNRETL